MKSLITVLLFCLTVQLLAQFTLVCQLPATITVSCIGYETMQVTVNDTNVTLEMNESLTQLRDIEVSANANPAHDILKKVYDKIPGNDPHALDSYSFNSYNKLSINF